MEVSIYMDKVNVTCIGGGHGLGHLLETLNDVDYISLTGIVCTTDNGGSTGRLRSQTESISWGDIRYCLSKLSEKTSIKSLLFQHRFEKLGDMSGHSLGNLMFCAVDSLCIRPTDSVKVMSEFLDINATILPMSDNVTNIVSHSSENQHYFGEIEVDKSMSKGIEKLLLLPEVDPSKEVMEAIKNSDVLLLGPGSFYTSIVPSLLMSKMVSAINNNKPLKVYFISNVQLEFHNQQDELFYQLGFLKNLGLSKTIHSIIPDHRNFQSIESCQPYTLANIPADNYGRHQQAYLKDTLLSFIC